jgi:hypothetical protein
MLYIHYENVRHVHMRQRERERGRGRKREREREAEAAGLTMGGMYTTHLRR